jgi:hypothetical protein
VQKGRHGRLLKKNVRESGFESSMKSASGRSRRQRNDKRRLMKSANGDRKSVLIVSRRGLKRKLSICY